MDNIYYDGTKLLNLLDLDGMKPAIYICTGNRTAGKTTYFNRYLVNRFLKHGEKFALLYRYDNRLKSCAEKFFKDIKELFFEDHELRAEKRENGKFYELYLDNVPCGYVLSLNSAESIKENSHFFSDIERVLLDEYQSLNNKYVQDEIDNFKSIKTSIARGKGKQVRYVQFILVGNAISLLNPYLVAFGLHKRIKRDTKFIRSHGLVMEITLNEAAAKAQQEDRFNLAFEDKSYLDFEAQNVYLDDSEAFIEKPSGKSRYLGTLTFKGKDYALREFSENGIVYCDDRPDKSYPFKIAVTLPDHNINWVMLKKNDMFLTSLRWYFDHGCFRFKNLQCKDAVFSALALN